MKDFLIGMWLGTNIGFMLLAMIKANVEKPSKDENYIKFIFDDKGNYNGHHGKLTLKSIIQVIGASRFSLKSTLNDEGYEKALYAAENFGLYLESASNLYAEEEKE